MLTSSEELIRPPIGCSRHLRPCANALNAPVCRLSLQECFKSVCRRRAAAPALFLKSLAYFRDPNGKTNQQSLQWVPSISSIMTPCRTEKVDFSKKIKKTESPKKQKNK